MAGSKAKPSVSIIGTGRLGAALAIGLQSSGYSIKSLVAGHLSKAEKAAKLLEKPRPITLGANDLDRVPPVDLLLIATPDDAIKGVASRLAAKTTRTGPRTKIALHTSGALSSEVLSPLADAGWHTGSIHPLVSVSDPRSGAAAFRGTFFCIEGDEAATRLAKAIVRDLGGKSFSIKKDHKALYHAAALTAAGHFTALVDLAIDMLVACGISQKRAQEVLMPLVESALKNLEVSPPEKALTGTFARGDVATVKRHLKVLSQNKLPGDIADAIEVYRLLGLRSLKLSRSNGLDPKVADEIERLLESR